MSGTVFTTAHFNGIALNTAGTENPATIASGAYVVGNTGTAPAHNGDAIYGDAGTAWTIVNDGTIVSGSANSSSVGIDLKSGGSVTSASAGSIAGEYAGIQIAGAAGTVANFGTIAASNFFGVYLHAGGRVTNGHSGSSAGLISGLADGVRIGGAAGTVANFGSITASGGFGVYLLAGGSVTNGHSGSSGGVISGYFEGVLIEGTTGTVANFGMIAASKASGVLLLDGGSVTNGQSGSIDASIAGQYAGIKIETAAGTVANFGIISGTNFGVELQTGGSVTVNRYALISGNLGISIAGAAGTVVSAGIIRGSGGTAIQFGAFNDTLILDPTAVVLGKVDGGTGNNTLELQAGATSGTLSALGSTFLNFGHVIVDPGANWTVEAAYAAGAWGVVRSSPAAAGRTGWCSRRQGRSISPGSAGFRRSSSAIAGPTAPASATPTSPG